MNELQFNFSAELTEKQQAAYNLHLEIRNNAEVAATALVNLALNLKKMRDSKQYEELGFGSFADYAEKASGIGQTQAYTYIQVVERLGYAEMAERSTLGITKLKMLTEIPAVMRDEFIEQNDIEHISTREMEELVKKATTQGEQISLLTKEVETVKSEKDDADAAYQRLQDELNAAREKIADLEERAEQAKAEPIEATGVSAENIEQIKAEAASEAKNKYQKELDKFLAQKEKDILQATEKAKKEGQAEAAEKAREELKNELENISAEKAEALERAEELKRELKVAGKPLVLKFSFYFDALKAEFEKLNDCLLKIKDDDFETYNKLSSAMLQFAELIKGAYHE